VCRPGPLRRLRRVRGVLLLLLTALVWPGIAGAAPLTAPGAAALPAPAAPAGVYAFDGAAPALVFDGKGWGHGVGLCQWGAHGRALAGQAAEQIVGTYFQGTSIQTLGQDATMRVLIDGGRRFTPGQTTRISALDGRWQAETGDAAPVEGPAGGFLELWQDGTTLRHTVKAQDGTKLGEGTFQDPLTLRPLEETTRFAVAYKPAGQVAGRPGTYYDTYRGELTLTMRSEGLETINRLSLQDYLRGVVPAEMPPSWPAEALKAQILTARSYAVWQARSRARQRYDVDDTVQHQVYLGSNVERANVNQLIDATAGKVIVHRGQVIQAVFFSTCAGWTENNESVWPGAPLPYLRGIQDVDPAGQPYDAAAPRFSWTTGALTTAQLQAILNTDPATAVGQLLALDLSQRTHSGRLLRVTATGTAGSKTFTPDKLVARFNRERPNGVSQLWSTNFDLKWTTLDAVSQTQGIVPLPPAVPAPGTVPAPPVEPPQVAAPTATAAPAAPTEAPAQVPTQVPTPLPTATPGPVAHPEYTQPVPARPDGPTNRYVPETGHNIGGAFLRFYDERGGLSLFGHPRTEEILEDGRTVQYFQRARFEYHTDKVGTPYEVQLTLLGEQLTRERPPFPTVEAFQNSDHQVYFPETGHSLSLGFLEFWRTNGGLDIFGYPISEEVQEENGDGSGRAYTVQYFQRARFEYHPELPEPYRISLGLLGDQVLMQRLWLK
ncbi:MAG TPA: SpoIID/LytB domain-containing protein, partial [Chloroflexota bacterium]|nr:SpoIID/LytB domain-containing protein [Chloroflexota bacterium]